MFRREDKMGYNILFFPWRDWNSMEIEGFRTREANILVAMFNNPNIDKILCVNRSKQPIYIKTILDFKNGGGTPAEQKESTLENNDIIGNEKILYKRRFSSLKEITNKLFILDIDYHLPNPKGNKLERFNLFENLLEKEIKVAIENVKLVNYITWCFDLTRIKIAEKFKENILIFDAIDNLLEHDQNRKDSKYLSKMYEFVNEDAELIFTVSQDLKKSLFSEHSKAFYIPNAINLDLYNKVNFIRPEDLPHTNPIVGYVGLMQERIDIEILETSIKHNQNINFVFVGPILSKSYFNGLKKYKNVYFLGPKHHSKIPSYLHYFDVCIIPHKVNNFTKSMNPLKLYEYLAAGKEVITTPVPPSEEYKQVIHIANEGTEFAELIKKCIKTPYRNFNKIEIMDSVKAEDWKIRLETMLELLEKELNVYGK